MSKKTPVGKVAHDIEWKHVKSLREGERGEWVARVNGVLVRAWNESGSHARHESRPKPWVLFIRGDFMGRFATLGRAKEFVVAIASGRARDAVAL